jgi:hypothetical protein
MKCFLCMKYRKNIMWRSPLHWRLTVWIVKYIQDLHWHFRRVNWYAEQYPVLTKVHCSVSDYCTVHCNLVWWSSHVSVVLSTWCNKINSTHIIDKCFRLQFLFIYSFLCMLIKKWCHVIFRTNRVIYIFLTFLVPSPALLLFPPPFIHLL